MSALAPLRLAPNRVRLFYRGGLLIDELRGAPEPRDDDRPEDWIGSVTPFGAGRPATEGLSSVEIGGRTVLLREVIAEAPAAYLGSAHAAALGASTALLVKLLDAAERLPLHLHPTRAFAREHLGSFFGKTEAWIVVATRSADAYVHLGWSRDIPLPELRGWVDRQDARAMLAATHRVGVAPGDVVHVPAGTPHAIGPGVFIVELQEPTNFSILIEHAGRPVDAAAAHLGLGWDTALASVERGALARERLAALVRHAALGEGESDLLPREAAPFFRARRSRLAAGARQRTAPAFWIGIVLRGEADLGWPGGSFALSRGDTVLVPHGLGECEVVARADLDLVRCLPPDPEHVA